MKKEQLSPTALDIFEMLVSTESVNMMAEFFHLPLEIRAKIIEDTNTIEERNIAIFRLCFMFFVANMYELTIPAEVHKLIKNDMPTLLESFIQYTSKLILEDYCGKITKRTC